MLRKAQQGKRKNCAKLQPVDIMDISIFPAVAFTTSVGFPTGGVPHGADRGAWYHQV
jgi:hypothetical protein